MFSDKERAQLNKSSGDAAFLTAVANMFADVQTEGKAARVKTDDWELEFVTAPTARLHAKIPNEGLFTRYRLMARMSDYATKREGIDTLVIMPSGQ
jgi:hypothetical protein